MFMVVCYVAGFWKRLFGSFANNATETVRHVLYFVTNETQVCGHHRSTEYRHFNASLLARKQFPASIFTSFPPVSVFLLYFRR